MSAIACPRCGGMDSKVTDSRRAASGGVRRRRACPCGLRYSTLEMTIEDMRDEIMGALRHASARAELDVAARLRELRLDAEMLPTEEEAAE